MPCPSIFTRKRPLADKTLLRILAGLEKFVGPFAVTREEAIALAEKLLAVFRMVRSPGPQKEEPMLVSVQFRGEERDVEIDHDHGFEPDTNAHEIEWHFYGLTPEQHAALEMTTEEEEAIFLQLQGVSDHEW